MRAARWFVGCGMALLWVSGCSDEGATPQVPPNYFPMAIGNWWVYAGVELDTAGNELPALQWRDSLVVVAPMAIGGKQGYQVVTCRDSLPWDTTIMATEGGKLYVYFDGQLSANIPLPAPRGWVLFADPTASAWVAWDTTVTGFPVELPGLPQGLTASGTFRWSGQRGGTLSLELKGRSVVAQEWAMTVTFSGDVFLGPLKVGTAQFRLAIRLWAAEGIGIVRRVDEPARVVLSVQALGQQQFAFNGQRLTLVDYAVR